MILPDKAIELIYYYSNNILDVYNLIQVSRKFLTVYRKMKVTRLMNKAKTKRETLKIFTNFYLHLPSQRSPDWLANRNGNHKKPPVIGGSEMKDLDAGNPRSLISRKLGLQKFFGVDATRWGNLFEDVFGSIFKFLFNSELEETGAIPGIQNNDGYTVQAYSPDGLMVVLKQTLKKILFAEFNKSIKDYDRQYFEFHDSAEDEIIILNEFKCPYSKIPDGKLPPEYEFQPPTGLCTIPIADIAIFANAVFRKCSIEDFKMNNVYDIEYHAKDQETIPDGFDDPLFMGMIGVYYIPENVESATKYNDNTEKLSVILHAVTDEDISDMSLMVAKYVFDDLKKTGSEYFGTELKLSNIMSIISLCDKFLNLVYEETGILTEKTISPKDEEQIVFNAIYKLIVIPSEMIDFVKQIIPDAIKVNFNLRLKTKSAKHIMDLGKMENSAFSAYLRKVVDDQHSTKGYKAYYSNGGMICSEEILSELDTKLPNIPENYLDPTLSQDKRCEKWLQQNINYFSNFCQKNGYKMVGILPWKSFKICIRPVFKDPEFINPFRGKLMEITSFIQSIKQKAVDKFADKKITEDELNKFYQEEINLKYGEKKTSTRKKSPVRIVEEKVIFDASTMDDFNDL